ncbi:MAG TPA: hypothetical protein VD839_14360 [Burkholderiales bacterium]|jgi:hypothetical protein|nr:hypothetical protein [Burkholderiales bacterium]
MMREILGVAPDASARRRWFHDDYFDLFVWQVASGEVTSFQLCYGIDSSERALVWQQQRGFFHDGIHGSSVTGDVIGSGIERGAQTGPDPVVARFDASASALPGEVRAAVAARIREYVEKQPPVQARRERFRRADWQKQPGPASKPERKPGAPRSS